MAEVHDKPVEKWTESDVSSWLRSIGVKEQYIQKLHEEEVDGKILKELTEDYLKKETGMKSGPALLIVKKRNELVESFQVHKPQKVKKTHASGLNTEAGRQNEEQGTDSKVSGFCGKYIQHHAANLHFMQNYKIPSDMSIREFESHLHLFEQTSWIFCNGRSDYRGNEAPCDEMTWIKTKITLLRESVSLICKQILPKGTFLVIFLLTSPVEKPLLHTFYEFFTDMEGHEDIICISECEDNYQKWKGFAGSVLQCRDGESF
ncbi:hypothetical protein AAFF_G00340300 [Aldrovandia affinis]|uniref:SAM domain-containing protein n=1 Tax=Aldrovandia affinis TaxID=143900 RepID=A0AAD7SLK8_9TELE|nr:hypothetical protein AAFF_G00340300 [Aldrovandia affinis]